MEFLIGVLWVHQWVENWRNLLSIYQNLSVDNTLILRVKNPWTFLSSVLLINQFCGRSSLINYSLCLFLVAMDGPCLEVGIFLYLLVFSFFFCDFYIVTWILEAMPSMSYSGTDILIIMIILNTHCLCIYHQKWEGRSSMIKVISHNVSTTVNINI